MYDLFTVDPSDGDCFKEYCDQHRISRCISVQKMEKIETTLKTRRLKLDTIVEDLFQMVQTIFETVCFKNSTCTFQI